MDANTQPTDAANQTADTHSLSPANQSAIQPCGHCTGARWHPAYPGCEITFRGSEKDDDVCAICSEPLEDGKRLIRHQICQRTIHETCFHEWMDIQANVTGNNLRADETDRGDEGEENDEDDDDDDDGANYWGEDEYEDEYEYNHQDGWDNGEDDNDNDSVPRVATCCFCRGAITALTHIAQISDVVITREASDNEGQRLRQLLSEGAKIYYVSKTHFDSEFLNNHRTRRDVEMFYRRHILPGHDGFDARYAVPATLRPGAWIFKDQEYSYPGVLSIRHCVHRTEYIMMTGQQNFECISDMYDAGWQAGERELQVRLRNIQITDERRPLIDVADAFRRSDLDVVWFSERELSLLTGRPYDRQKINFFIRMHKDRDRPGWLQVKVLLSLTVFKDRWPIMDRLLCSAGAVKWMTQRFGGFGPNVDVMEFGPQAANHLYRIAGMAAAECEITNEWNRS